MSPLRLTVLTLMTMLAFAANSLLCREALAAGHIDPSSFTLVRIVSGSLVLGILLLFKFRRYTLGGSWLAAAALFGYAAAFSFAYVSLSAGTGALLLFGAVQATMIGYGLWRGERLSRLQIIGGIAATGGLIWLMLPGIDTPPLLGALIMISAGVCWGVYSLMGRRTSEPSIATAGNFIRAIPFAVIMHLLMGNSQQVTNLGLAYAVASGALASGLGYALWYAVLPALPASRAAMIQLSVPILAAIGGMLFLNEAVTLRFGLASLAVLGGIALFIMSKKQSKHAE
ncbi:DMT family transporter [Zhongshania guokunii]|uniref:DMT family transporter n=1 Tax=Zhongshania guokunii TaxID=641783 RepID=A0ABV3U7G7_9GAMM